LQREIIAEVIKAEKTEIGVIAAEIAADESAGKTMGETEKRGGSL
jgi:hypothetical protein